MDKHEFLTNKIITIYLLFPTNDIQTGHFEKLTLFDSSDEYVNLHTRESSWQNYT